MTSRKAISQVSASMVTLAATAVIVAITLSSQLPGVVFVQKAGVEQAAEAEEAAGVKLSLVALIDGRAVIANDGARPVTVNKLITPSGVTVLDPPITIEPGQKVSVLVGNAEALALGVEGTGNIKVVLKEKPGLSVATATSFTSCCVTTRYMLTRSTTVYRTTYTPYYVTETVIPPLQTSYSTTTITHKLTKCISCYYGTTSTRIYTSYYSYTPYTAQLATRTHLTTALILKTITSSSTTSLNTAAIPWTLWYITEVVTTLPTVTTTTITSTATATLPTYATTTYTTTTVSHWWNELTSTSVVIRPTATTTTTATVTVTTVVVS